MMISLGTARDFDALTDIWLQASVQAHNFVDKEYWHSKMSEIRNKWLPAAQTKVWKESGRCLGFISIIDHNYIGALFVDPAFQRRGIGQRLIDAAKQECSCLRLKVFVKNEPAVKFYIRCGFTIQKLQKDAETKEDEYIMQWKTKR